MSESEGQSSFEMGTQIALRQIQVAIGVVMGQSLEEVQLKTEERFGHRDGRRRE